MTQGTTVSILIVNTPLNNRDGVSYQVAQYCCLQGENVMRSTEPTMAIGVQASG